MRRCFIRAFLLSATFVAKWLDQQGSYMAAVAAGPVFRLLGAKDFGASDDYHAEKMLPVNQGQHDGGHTDAPSVEHFIAWAEKHWGGAR